MKKWLKKPALWDGLAVTALSLGFLIYSIVQFQAMQHKVQWIMSPYLFPMMIGVFAVALGASMIREGLKAQPAAPKADAAETGEQPDAAAEPAPHRSALRMTLDALTVVALTVLYDLALGWIGFLPATAVYLALMMLFLGERRWYVMLIAAAATPFALYAIFKLGLNVRLP